MADNPLLRKMHIKPGQRLLLLNAPDGYLPRLQPLPEGVDLIQVPEGPVDAVHLFVKDKAELHQHASTAINSVKPGGLLWMSYPKKSSRVKTDLTRDIGWDVVTDAGWTGIAQVSIDDTWSATRFRPAEDVKRRRIVTEDMDVEARKRAIKALDRLDEISRDLPPIDAVKVARESREELE